MFIRLKAVTLVDVPLFFEGAFFPLCFFFFFFACEARVPLAPSFLALDGGQVATICHVFSEVLFMLGQCYKIL